jgi:hypothetical protein
MPQVLRKVLVDRKFTFSNNIQQKALQATKWLVAMLADEQILIFYNPIS